jgi:hypothetical protein
MKTILTILVLIIASLKANAQISVERFDLTIETELSDTLQRIYEQFLNESVEKISIVRLKKKYSHSEYYHFLKNKKIHQSRKKWLKNNSHEESIIIEGNPYPLKHIDSMVFEYRFHRIEKEFIQSELFLDSAETKLALNEMFNGVKNEIIDMCYNPRHAVVFYNSDGEVSGIYEICFECSNVKIGIVGTLLIPRLSPYLKGLFQKYVVQLK